MIRAARAEERMDTTKASKFLSLVLRHEPSAANVALDAGGWANVDALVAGSGGRLTRELVAATVAENTKRRFALSPDGTHIRARQGHSVPVDLGLGTIEPPTTLYHGTVERFLDAIMAEGLTRQSRQHVHLSADVKTARTVGARRGKPIVLVVDAAAMHAAGHPFFRSENGVWLTDAVPPRFLTRA